jgi:general secretion pathway protein F
MARLTRIDLEALVALNDEIAALTRAGVPLVEGLRAASRDMSGRLAKLATQLSERLEAGESLDQALSDTGGDFSPVYRAVVAVGVRSGRLAAALESISRTARRLVEIRRVMLASLIYPLAVLMVASVLFVFTISRTAPIVYLTYERLGLQRPGWYEQWYAVAQGLQQLLPWLWVLLVVVVAVWWIRSSRLAALTKGGARRGGGLARVLHAGQMATFAEILALLVEQEVPLDEAVVLASTASGDQQLARGGRQLGADIRSGRSSDQLPSVIPPLLGWLVLTGAHHQHLVTSLRQTADSYRRRALMLGTWLSVYLPIFLSAGIGGVVVLAYVVFVMAPFYNLLFAVS